MFTQHVCFRQRLISRRYSETIDIFYHANTIHISSTILSSHLNSILLPQRLANISSLELVWNMLDYDPSEIVHQPGGPMALYKALMTTITTSTLPALLKLHIWVEARHHYSNDPEAENTDFYESRLFEPADALVQEYYGLKKKFVDLQLAPNLSLFMGLIRRAERKGRLRVEKGGGTGIASWRRFWRPVSVDDRDGGGIVDGDAGYWVREGKDDTPVWYVWVHHSGNFFGGGCGVLTDSRMPRM